VQTAANLKEYTYKDLAQMAKQRGISGWHSMRKDQLVSALAQPKNDRKSKATMRPDKPESATRRATSKQTADTAAPPKKRLTAVQRRIRKANAQRDRMQDLATDTPNGASSSAERVVLMVRDPYWLHAFWELPTSSVERAKAALAENWHGSRPVLRLLQVTGLSEATRTELVVREIDIHGGVNNWYIDVQDPPASFRVEIGYSTGSGRFYGLARSNCVSTPKSGSPDMIDGNWEDVVKNSDKIYAMSGGYSSSDSGGAELQELLEERLRRPIGSPMVTRFGQGAEAVLGRNEDLMFSVDVEVVVFGVASSGSYVTMSGEPVKLGPGGSFAARMSMPNRRQVIPLVASTRDGVEEQTIILALERNTKFLEPKIREIGQ